MDGTSHILIVLLSWYVIIGMLLLASILFTAYVIIPSWFYLTARYDSKVRTFLAMIKDKDVSVNYRAYPYKSQRFEIQVSDDILIFDASSSHEGKLLLANTPTKVVSYFDVKQTEIITKALNVQVQKTLKKNQVNFIKKYITKPTIM